MTRYARLKKDVALFDEERRAVTVPENTIVQVRKIRGDSFKWIGFNIKVNNLQAISTFKAAKSILEFLDD